MITVAVLLVSLVGATSALPEHVSIREMQAVLRENMVEMFQGDVTDLESGKCTCANLACSCCAHIKIKEIHVDNECCANITYLKKNIGFQFSFSVDGKVIYKKEISAKNPPAVCVDIPGMKSLAKACVQFYNLSVTTSAVSGCIRLEAKLLKFTKKVEIGCYKIPIHTEGYDVILEGVETNAVSDYNDYMGQREIQVRLQESLVGVSDIQEGGAELDDNVGEDEIQAVLNGPCSCTKEACSCCERIKIPKIGVHSMCCANFTFLPKEIGFQFTFSVDGKVIFKNKVSVKNPNPICVKIPGMMKLAKVCLIFYDLSVSGKSVSGCLRLEAKLAGKKVAKITIGCFKIKASGFLDDGNGNHLLPLLLSQGTQPVKSYERIVFN